MTRLGLFLLMFVFIAAGAEPGGGCGRNCMTITVSSRSAASAGISEYAFQDAAIEVGDTLTWTNNGNEPHSVTSDTGIFGSATLNPKDSYSFQFNQAGDFPYHCSIHGFMTSHVRVVPPGSPAITSSLMMSGLAETPFTYTIISNGTAPLTFAASGLPAGLTLNGATISGVPEVGNFQILLTASNAIGQDSQTLYLNVALPPAFLSPSTASVQVGAPFNYTIDATGTAPLNYFASSLPLGLILSGNSISGSVATPGVYVALLSVSGGGAIATQSLSISVLVPQNLVTSPLACIGKIGNTFSYTLSATEPVDYTAGLLPPGLTLNGNSISGTPAVAGFFAVALTAENSTAIDTQIMRVTILDTNSSNSMVDSDGNGVPDELQNGAGPVSALALPGTLAVSKLTIRLSFSTAGNDTIAMSGSLGISRIAAGSKFVLDVGGVIQTFTVNAKGSAVEGRNRLRIIPSKGGTSAPKFSLNLQGMFAPNLADEKLTNNTVTGLSVSVPVAIVVNNTLFSENVRMRYSALIGKTGKAAIAR